MTDQGTAKRVLIVEDNPLLAYDLEDLIRDHGLEPVGPALDLQTGIMLARENQLHGALLDIDLGEDRVWPLARELKSHTVPFAFISAQCSGDMLPPEFADHDCIEKPAEREQIAATVTKLVGFD